MTKNDLHAILFFLLAGDKKFFYQWLVFLTKMFYFKKKRRFKMLKKSASYSSTQEGFQVFKKRLRQVLIVSFDLNLYDYYDDEPILRLYHQGESPEFAAEVLAS